MCQDLAKTSIVGFVVEKAFHSVNFTIHFVAIGRDHGQSRTGINKVSPVPLRQEFVAQILGKIDKLCSSV